MGLPEPNKSTDTQKNDSSKASFEDAIVQTGFGKFNIMLLCFVIPSSFTQAFEQMSLSYILPIAQCDLELTLEDKGLLNAVTFAGMISSGLVFGIICDNFGRRKLIVYGFLLHTIFQVIAALSSNLMILMIAKFFCGFIFNGPFSATMTYLSEFHGSEYRARVQLLRGLALSCGFFVLTTMAWVFLPLSIEISLFGILDLHSWNLFLLFCALPPFLATVFFAFMPESPKFLMCVGKNEEALQVFQLVYSVNTGRPKQDFPIKELQIECEISPERTDSIIDSFLCAWNKLKPLFKRPFILRIILISLIAMTITLNLTKMWLPQFLQITNDYEQENNHSIPNICEVVEIMKSSIGIVVSDSCHVNRDNSFVYKIALMVNGVQMVLFIASGFFVNLLGKKTLMSILAAVAMLSALGIYFATNSIVFITFFATFLPALDLAGVISISINLEMFPTEFRTIAISIHLAFSRIGLVIANTVLPLLVSAGCTCLFLTCTVIVGVIPVLVLMLPNTENKALL